MSNEKTIQTEVTVSDWDEEPYPKSDEMPKVSLASWHTSYDGELSGRGEVRVLLTYTGGDAGDPHTLEADYVGYEKVDATVGDKTGAFVLRVRGSHGKDGAAGTGEIVPGSGTGDFAGSSGSYEGTATAMTYPVTFTFG